MALVDTWKAIGKASKLLRDRLEAGVRALKDDGGNALTLSVTVGRPEPPDTLSDSDKTRLNLFLYEALFDPSLKNVPLEEGRPEPLWMVLKYIMTAFDDNGDSDTSAALEYLGAGVQVLQTLNYLTFSDMDYPAHRYNPEYLKITFDEASSDLLSRIMQGTDERYRFSIAFQLRPILIVPDEEPAYPTLVGIDYTETPQEIIGEEGIQIPVIPAPGAVITSLSPSRFESGDEITAYGSNLNVAELSAELGDAAIQVISQGADSLKCVIAGPDIVSNVISAGNHPFRVFQELEGGRRRSSNILSAYLLPTLTSAELKPAAGGTRELELTGILLGSPEDDIRVALCSEDSVFELFEDVTGSENQTSLTLEIDVADSAEALTCRAVLQVNGQEARNRPKVEESSP